jgi:cell division cycle 14
MQLLDCLRGLEYAIKLGWFNYKTFNLAEYEHYEKIENGDLNWILPNKFVAFSSPSDKPVDKYGVRPIALRTVPSRPTTTCPSSRS